MAIAVQSFQTNTSTGSASVVVTKPVSLAVGDLMVGFVTSNDNTETGGAINLPSGWTSITTGDRISISGSACAHLRAFYKVADSSDAAASNFTFTAADAPSTMFGAIYRITGQTLSSITDGSGSGVQLDTATPSIAAGFTPTTANNLYLMLGGSIGGPPTGFSSQAIATDNPSWTEDFEDSGSSVKTFGAHATRSQTTATGNVSFSNGGDATTDNGVILVAIKEGFGVTVSPATVTGTSTVNAPTVSGGATVEPATVTATSTVNIPTSMGQAIWSNQSKNTTTWTNENKS